MDLGSIGGFSFNKKRYQSFPIQIVHASDFDERAVEIYNANFSHKAIVQDVTKLSASELPDHDILTGGFPCQSFSVAATNPPRLGYTDLRGQLFFEIVRILNAKRPKVFIAENVKGLLSANQRMAFPLVLQEFQNAGYFIHWKVLNASSFGVPQKRERVFIVGFREERHFKKFSFPENERRSLVPLKTVLEQEVGDEFFFSERAVHGMRKTKNSALMNKGRAQDPNSPCNTVGAHLAKVSLNSTDPVLFEKGRYRMFTPREVARIQSFPDSFKLVGSRSANYRGLGNAVAPVMMWHVIEQVLKAVD